MEPMILFSVALVAYLWYRTVLDLVDDLRRERADEVPEAASGSVQPVRVESGAASYVVGMEQLSKRLAARAKRSEYPSCAALAWRRQGAL
jgi:hypothetical protein